MGHPAVNGRCPARQRPVPRTSSAGRDFAMAGSPHVNGRRPVPRWSVARRRWPVPREATVAQPHVDDWSRAAVGRYPASQRRHAIAMTTRAPHLNGRCPVPPWPVRRRRWPVPRSQRCHAPIATAGTPCLDGRSAPFEGRYPAPVPPHPRRSPPPPPLGDFRGSPAAWTSGMGRLGDPRADHALGRGALAAAGLVAGAEGAAGSSSSSG